MRTLVLFLIRLYQKTLSPDHGVLLRWKYPYGYCKYYPTCSCYTREAIERRGVWKGVAMGAWRVLRCNPWSKGGVDPVQK